MVPGETPAVSDETLLQQMQSGDVRAFDALILRFYQPLLAIVVPIVGDADTGDDVLQTLFVRLWEKRGTLTIPVTVRAYLYTAARNTALNVRQRDVTRARLEQQAAAIGQTGDVVLPSEQLEWDEFARTVAHAVAELPPRGREIYQLSQQHGLAYREIAQILGLALPTVKTHMARAIATLERRLRPFVSKE